MQMAQTQVRPASAVAPEELAPLPSGSPPGLRLLSRLFPALVFLFVFTVYFITISPTTSFWDSGEFIAVSKILGLPHPPGTPLYVLVGRLFSFLPFHDPALGVNLLSALSGALAILFLHLSIVRIVMPWRRPDEGVRMRFMVAHLSAAVASIIAAFSATFWTNAIEAEVYAPSAFLMSFATWLMLKWSVDPRRPGQSNLLLAVAYILALGIGYHLGTYLAAPPFLLFILATDPRALRQLRLWVWGAGLTVLGLSVHLFIPIRSMLNPDIDENDPQTLGRFLYYIGRRQYKPNSIFDRQAPWDFQFDHFWRYFTEQFPVWIALLGIIGLAIHVSRNRRTFILWASTFLITGLGLIIYMNFTATEVRERDYFYTTAFFTYAAWIGIGAGGVVSWVRERLAGRGSLGTTMSATAGVALLLIAIVPLRVNFHTHDRRGDYIANDYGYNLLVGLDPNAIIFTNGDNDTFPLWFMQEVKKFRKDVRVVNLSLLNTDWYILQLKNEEPKVPISIPDDQIPLLKPYRTEDRIVYVRDIAMFDIINTTKFSRPIYFAVTVPGLDDLGLLDHLVLEGLAFKLVEKKTSDIDPAKLEDNLYHKYRYRGLLTPDGRRDVAVYHDPNATSLVTNYSAAFIRLCMEYNRQGKTKEALRACEMAGEIAPNYVPYRALMGPLYAESGDYAKAEEFLKKQIALDPSNPEFHLHLGYTYEQQDRDEEALASYLEAADLDPDYGEALRRAAQLEYRMGRVPDAVKLLERWLARHPDDENTRKALDELRQQGGDSGKPDQAKPGKP